MRFLLCLLALATTVSAQPAEKLLRGKWARVAITDSDLDDNRRWQEIHRWIDHAMTEGTENVVFDINVTHSAAQPFLPLAEEIARLKVPTKAYVNTSAIGAGALLALACDEIWMASGSRIGAAAPKVKFDEELSPKAQDTQLSEALAVLKAGARGLCHLKGHRPEIADAFVDRDKGLTLGTLKLADKGELLLLDANVAAEIVDGKPVLAKGVVTGLDALLKAAGGAEDKLVSLNASWFEKQSARPEDKAAKPAPEAKTEVSSQIKTPVVARDQSYKDKVIVIPVGAEDLLIPARFEFMKRTLGLCNKEGAEAVIFDLDTPGGLAWDTITLMMKDLQNLKTRSFAFVNTRAISAGALIAMATDGIYMAPASAIGASTPVTGSGESLGDAERAKMNSAFLGMVRTVVREKGHDVRIAEGMIDRDRGLTINGRVIIPKGEIVTLDSEQATMLIDGKPLLAKGIARSIEEIKQRESLKGEVIIAEPTGFEWIAIWVTRYAAILILLGLAGGYLEMQTPGFGIPGFIALGAFALFFFGHYVAGSLAGQETAVVAVIFILGIVLIGVELLAAPGTIVPGVLGFCCVMVALVYAMSGWEVPPPGDDAPGGIAPSIAQYAVGLRNFALGGGGAIALITLLALWLPALRPFRALVLHTAAGGTLQDAPSMQAAAKARAGDAGITRSALRPYGSVEIDGRVVEAMVEGGYLNNGTPVRVREVRGEKIIVEPVA